MRNNRRIIEDFYEFLKIGKMDEPAGLKTFEQFQLIHF